MIENRQELVQQLREFFQDPTVLAVTGVILLVYTLSWYRLFSRAGYNGAVGLLMLVPGLNIVMLLVLAFGPWPTEHELRALRHVQKAARKAEEKHYKKQKKAA